MKRSKKIKVLGQSVTVTEVAGLKNEDGHACHGLCEVQRRAISIDKGLDDGSYDRVLRHEVFHMRVGIAGINEMMSEELEEALAVLAEID